MHRIILIEDDLEFQKLVAALCENELHSTLTLESDGKRGLERALDGDFELALIDAKLPTMSGFDICRELRRCNPHLAIIFLTAKSDEVDKVVGLEVGADDYVTKPFRPRELAARIRGVLRRAKAVRLPGLEPPPMTFGHLELDPASRRVWKDKKLVRLTLVEFELLFLLARNPGRTFERGELLEQAMGYASVNHGDSLTVHLSRIRSKIERDPERPQLIKTIRGLGYRFAAADEIGGLQK